MSSNESNKLSLILPVLFYEYLAISITKSLIPNLLLKEFTGATYIVVGIMETIKGFLAFITCPFFGKISDHIGRKYCLLFTVIGSTLPVCILAFTQNIYIYVIMMAISGIFSATFPLSFAYISDCVEPKKRAPAYGLALATFGLSFSIGPVSGSYIASQFGNKAVFITSFILVIINVVYIITVLPETVASARGKGFLAMHSTAIEQLPNSWNINSTFKIFSQDPFLKKLASIVFLYYTAIWALVSTLVVYVTRYLHFDAVQLGALMSAYGLATMISEAVLVRIIVPQLGEITSMKIGLIAFALQCILVAFADTHYAIAFSVLLSMVANLVYPSISSLVSRIVSEKGQGEALGALNGMKAITEGFGPLVFGTLMSLYETSFLPGAPYLLGTFFALFAFLECCELPTESEYGYDYKVAYSYNEKIREKLQKIIIENDGDNDDDDDDDNNTEEDMSSTFTTKRNTSNMSLFQIETFTKKESSSSTTSLILLQAESNTTMLKQQQQQQQQQQEILNKSNHTSNYTLENTSKRNTEIVLDFVI